MKIEIKNYQTKKPFTSFLPGIAGQFGKPLWTFYTNRGQLMMSFGYQDKNGAILEFYPANLAYMYEKINGFKTFVKLDNNYYSFFKEPNDFQTLFIEKDKVTIEEVNETLKLKVRITYLTLPNEDVAALARYVEIENLGEKREIELLDGLTQMLPSGIDYGGYKAVSNLLQSWMDVDLESGYGFYKLRGSTDDTSIISEIVDGNFFITKINGQKTPIICDIKKVFTYDTSFQTPHGFMEGMSIHDQVTINQVPCAYTYYQGEIEDKLTIESLFGYTQNKQHIQAVVDKLDGNYLKQKIAENKQLIDETIQEIHSKTAYEKLDAYFKQSLLDNVLRGGKPYLFEIKDGFVNYHLFSRKHGDPERDYNFFSLDPTYFSQGNGNFRDVLQNRRNDNFFYKDLKAFNIKHFVSLIQADGYNPLSIEGVSFKDDNVYTPGVFMEKATQEGLSLEEAYDLLLEKLKHSTLQIEANFGEGFWQDHFTYIYDLIENYLRIYPDEEETLLFETFVKFFNSPVSVKPRIEKTYKDKTIRQHNALTYNADTKKWLDVEVSILSKLITLIINKFLLLDSDNLGIMYEANKPGWNDALNGLPGIFGSGIGEMMELLRLTQYVHKVIQSYPQSFQVLTPLNELIIQMQQQNLSDFNDRMTLIEAYRSKLDKITLTTVDLTALKPVLSTMLAILTKSFETIKQEPIIPTYRYYEVTDYQPTGNMTDLGELVMPLTYQGTYIKPFLEGPARSMKLLNQKDALKQYKAVKASELYDEKLNVYKTSVNLDSYSHDLGRIRMFTKGWLERESNFLHMTYKYLFGLLKAGLYDAFYEEIKTNFVCFMDEQVYGRSILENSSFIATSNNPDPKNHGRGFVSRLSGSTAELLSMYTYMFLGRNPFIYEDGLKMVFKPILHKDLFKDGRVETKLYETTIIYHSNESVYEKTPQYIEVIDGDKTHRFETVLDEFWSMRIRQGDALKINVYY